MSNTISSEDAVSSTIKKSLYENGSKSIAAGIVLGSLASIVLSRGGASSTRKAIVGFGTGVGIGSAWTKCSLDIEELLGSR